MSRLLAQFVGIGLFLVFVTASSIGASAGEVHDTAETSSNDFSETSGIIHSGNQSLLESEGEVNLLETEPGSPTDQDAGVAFPGSNQSLLEAGGGVGILGTVPVSPTVQDANVAFTDDDNLDILLIVPNLGYVADTGDHTDPDRLKIGSFSETVEYSLWHYNSLTQGHMGMNSHRYVSFPSQISFIVTIARPNSYKIGVLFCSEVSDVLSCSTLRGGSSAIFSNEVVEILLTVDGLGGVRDTGIEDTDYTDGYELNIYADSNTVEWSVWYYGYWRHWYTTTDVDVFVPHYRSFIVTIWRYDDMGHLFCRTNDYRIVCSKIEDGAMAITSDSNEDLLASVLPLADVEDTGGPSDWYKFDITADIYASLGFQWSKWRYDSYSSGTTTVWNVRVTFQHWRTFIVTVHLNDNIVWLICRENDRMLGCSSLALATYDMNRNQEFKGLDSFPPTTTSYMDRAAMWHNTDRGEAAYSLQSSWYKVYVYAAKLSGSGNGHFICQNDGSDDGSVREVTSTTPRWYYCDTFGSANSVGFRNVDNEWIGFTWYGNSDLWIGDDPSTDYAMFLWGISHLDDWDVHSITWRGVDSKPIYQVPYNTDWHVEIDNHAVLAHSGDSSYLELTLPSSDSLRARFYGRDLSPSSQARLIVDGSTKETIYLTSYWAWQYFANAHSISGSGTHEVRLKSQSGTIAITHIRLVY